MAIYLSVLLITYLANDPSSLPLLGMAHGSGHRGKRKWAGKGKVASRDELHKFWMEEPEVDEYPDAVMNIPIQRRMRVLLQHVDSETISALTVAGGSHLGPDAIEAFANGKRQLPQTLLSRLEDAFGRLRHQIPPNAWNSQDVETEPLPPPEPLPSVSPGEHPDTTPPPSPVRTPYFLFRPGSEFHDAAVYAISTPAQGKTEVEFVDGGYRRIVFSSELRLAPTERPQAPVLTPQPQPVSPREVPAPRGWSPKPDDVLHAIKDLRKIFPDRLFFPKTLIAQQSGVEESALEQILSALASHGKVSIETRDDGVFYSPTAPDTEKTPTGNGIHPAILTSLLLIGLAGSAGLVSIFASQPLATLVENERLSLPAASLAAA